MIISIIIIYFVMIITIMIIMIRSVLSRAELEALPLDNNLKEDVAKGKVINDDDSDDDYDDDHHNHHRHDYNHHIVSNWRYCEILVINVAKGKVVLMMTLVNGEHHEYDELNPIEMTMIMKPNFRSVSSVFQITNFKFQICFLCMKTKFGIFNWGCRCQMCSQMVSKLI